MKNHTLVIICAGDCERDEDSPDVCTCSSFGWEYQLICPDEDGVTILTECGVWEKCGCVPGLIGPRLADGSPVVALIPRPDGKVDMVLDDYDAADVWDELVMPICPRTGLPHHYWEGELFVSTTECFGRQSAECYDKESFDPVASKVFQPGEYAVTWTAPDGWPEWQLAPETREAA